MIMWTKRNLVISIAAFVAMAVVFIAAMDWVNDEDSTRSRIIVRNPKHSKPASEVKVQPLSPAGEETPATNESEEVAVTLPEPPKEVTYEEAEAAFHERRYEEAVELFTRYTDRKSKNPWGYYMLGLSSWKAGDNESAEKALTQALGLDPQHVKSWINLSRVLLDEGKPKEASAKIDAALEIDPESNAAHRLKGRAFHLLGQKDQALAAYRQAIQIDNNDAWSMNNMALIFIEEERFDEALPPLARAIELRDDIAIFQNNLGMVLEHMGYFRSAEEAYASAVAIDASYDKALANLDRVETVREDPGLVPIDLGVVAQSFIEKIDGWNVAVVDVEEVIEQPGFSELKMDSIVVSEADSTESRQEQ